MTSPQLVAFIATVWRVNEESGWYRQVERRWAISPHAFRSEIMRESADDEIYIGPIGISKDQTTRGRTKPCVK